MTKMFPETREFSHPSTNPATRPVAVNLKIFFARAFPPVGQSINQRA
jgi:hypothetical protein